MKNRIIDGIKLIRHNAHNINESYDKNYPYIMKAYFSPPAFMQVAFIFLCGHREEIIVTGKNVAVLEEFIELNEFEKHPRFIEIKKNYDYTGEIKWTI